MHVRLATAIVGLTALAVTATPPSWAADGGRPTQVGPVGVGGASSTVAAPGPARVGTSVVLGQTAPGSTVICGPLTGVQAASGAGAPSFTAPTGGVITAYSHRANASPGSVRILAFRGTSTTRTYTVVGKSALHPVTPSTLNTFPARIPVRAGDHIGAQVTDGMGCRFSGVAGDRVEVTRSFDPDATTTFTSAEAEAGLRLNLSAVLEPDADGDGFGDASQDACPQSALTQAACPAPETTVTKRPAKRTEKRRVKVAFTSSVPGSTFTCTLDGKRSKPCTSPFRKRLRPGKHTLLIQAVSPAGIAEVAPAKVKFRILR